MTEHVRNCHASQPDVIIMLANFKKNPGCKESTKKLYFVADLMYNTDESLNKGVLRVSRAPQTEKSAVDFTNCPKCHITLSAAEFRFHGTKCMKISGKNCKNLAQLGSSFIKKCSSVACETLRKQVIYRMRNDAITQGIRYDNLII